MISQEARARRIGNKKPKVNTGSNREKLVQDAHSSTPLSSKPRNAEAEDPTEPRV